MPLTHEFTFPLTNGLHARPASELVGVASAFSSAITFSNPRTGRAANLRSVLALVATDTRQGDLCRLEIAGNDEEAAVTALRDFVGGAFLECDEPAPVEASTEILIPRALRAAGLQAYHAGQIACRGLGLGHVVIAGGFKVPSNLEHERPENAAAELARFERAHRSLVHELETAARQARGPEAAVLSAHLAIVNDPLLGHAIANEITAGWTAGQAVATVTEQQRQTLLAADSAYIRERVLDVEDIAQQLWAKLSGIKTLTSPVALNAASIVFAESLTPSQFLALDRRFLAGLVLGRAGQTSHAVILARSFGVPTLTGVPNVMTLAAPGTAAVLDANVGLVLTEPSAAIGRYYDREMSKQARIAAALAARGRQPACTADGHRIEVAANIATAQEAVWAFAHGAEGIGLFRTELLFADHKVPPGEEEQYTVYAQVVAAAEGRPVIIRTLDVGGDKPVPFLTFPAESNPFLGYRGVRFYAAQAALIKTQLRALLRAAAHGPLKILVPMVATVEEARLVRRLLTEARAELVAAGHSCDTPVPLGLMLEVPSVAFILDELAAEADFFSLGTNDLAQYFHAADRENPKVSALHDPLQPGFLRLLKHIVDRVHARGRWIGLCGEMAENPAALPLLVGLGLDEISLAAPRIAATKTALARLDRAACAALLERVTAVATADEIRPLLTVAPAEPLPLLASHLVMLELDAASKAEAIRSMVDELHVAGRTTDPTAVEEAVWRREETYSTGFGDGFALPHCQTDALTANSIVVARLRAPIDWRAIDGQPVDLIILLGIRASEHGKAHMQTLARLSRLLMRDEFRVALRREHVPDGMVALLQQATRPLDAATATKPASGA